MARLILKCRYLKAGGAKHSENLIRYIATRDGVEKIDDTWQLQPATKAQRELIAQLISDFPDVAGAFEYQDYVKSPTKGTASECISRAFEDNVDLISQRENYVAYIAKRPRVEKQGSHGLFTDSNIPIRLSAVAKEVAMHSGNVWTNILSLRREDATRLGYDNGEAWRNLLSGQAGVMAEAMKIPLEDLRWYAAFHNESHHPHVHVVAYSVGKEPYMTEQGLLKMKSAFAREIFRQDLLQTYEQQTKHRNTLNQESRSLLEEITEQIYSGGYANETVELMLRELAKQLANTKGKKVYGYLPQKARNLVNGIVDELEKDQRIQQLYDLWYEQREVILQTYTDRPPERLPLSQNKTFRAVKNAVIQEALNPLYDCDKFVDKLNESNEGATGSNRKPIHDDIYIRKGDSLFASVRLFARLLQMLREEIEKSDKPQRVMEKKLRQKIIEKEKAHGIKIG